VLTPGSRLGPYDIHALIGHGGMGEVYRATDTRLRRDVALKVLPAAFAADADRLTRFEREAQVLASLNHPHIASIYGIEESHGVRALVMELVEGPTLADRLAHGAIATDEALSIARQIADALEAAHEAGIIHRDLKPANIKLRPDGTVKVLDFGLAKAAEPAVSAGAFADSPTLTSPAMMTHAGVILGTAAYMSPEQARGKSVDRRTDIWAFGCVLFEMLTGKAAFHGSTVTETLASVMRDEPRWDMLPNALPAHWRRVLRGCLQKDPKHRLRHIGDTLVDLDGDAPPQVGKHGRPAPTALALAVAAVGAFGIAAWIWMAAGPSERPSLPPLMFELPPVITPTVGAPAGGMLSPDGTRVAYGVLSDVGALVLAVRDLRSGEVTVFRGTEGAHSLFWSPDSASVGFFANRKLVRLHIESGKPQVIADAPTYGRGAAWSVTGRIAYQGSDNALWEVSSSGEAPRRLVVPNTAAGERIIRWPNYLPDGRRLYVAVAGVQNYIAIVDSQTGALTKAINGYSPAVFSRGSMLFVRDGALFSVPVDATTYKPVGEPRLVIKNVDYQGLEGAASFSVAENGMLSYALPSHVNDIRLQWFAIDGRPLMSLSHEPLSMAGSGFSLSPNDRTIAVGRSYEDATRRDVWTMDVAVVNTSLSRFTSSAGDDTHPVWSPKGDEIAFYSSRADRPGLYRRSVGAASNERFFVSDVRPTDWTRDGRWLIGHRRLASDGPFDIVMVDAHDATNVVPLVTSDYDELQGQVSPDGEWLAYISNESGAYEVYVQRRAGGSGRRKLSLGSGHVPRWTPDGRSVMYLTTSGALMRSALSGGPPEVVVHTRTHLVIPTFFRFALSSDGQRILVAQPADDRIRTMVLLNWEATSVR
jgi:eukaryotic-like serine/threonine-protein kinase